MGQGLFNIVTGAMVSRAGYVYIHVTGARPLCLLDSLRARTVSILYLSLNALHSQEPENCLLPVSTQNQTISVHIKGIGI